MPFLSTKLTEARKKLGLNQVEFAAYLIRHGAPHITKAAVNNWENGTRPKDLFFDVIRKSTGLDANFFYGDGLSKQSRQIASPRKRPAPEPRKAPAGKRVAA